MQCVFQALLKQAKLDRARLPSQWRTAFSVRSMLWELQTSQPIVATQKNPQGQKKPSETKLF